MAETDAGGASEGPLAAAAAEAEAAAPTPAPAKPAPQDKPEAVVENAPPEKSGGEKEEEEAVAEKKEEAATAEKKEEETAAPPPTAEDEKEEDPRGDKEEAKEEDNDGRKEGEKKDGGGDDDAEKGGGDSSDDRKEEGTKGEGEKSEGASEERKERPAAADEEDAAEAAPTTPETPADKKRKRAQTKLESLVSDSLKTPTSAKRERKSVERLEAPNFKADQDERKESSDRKAGVGRGTPLEDIDSVTEIIKKKKTTDPALNAAHRLLFSSRGKAAQRTKRSQILKFNGYLPPYGEDMDEKEKAAVDENAEAKMAAKAYKLKVPDIKMLCDLFDVDRSGTPSMPVLDKEALIDRLLDFLGAPDEKLTKGYAKRKKARLKKKESSPSPAASKKRKSGEGGGKVEKRRKTKKKKVKTAKRVANAKEAEEEERDDEETEEEEESDEEEEIKVEADSSSDDAATGGKPEDDGKPKMPTDKQLRKWVRAYVTCFNLDKATTKHAIETASDKFGVDVTEKKGRIKELLTDEMT